MCTGEYRRPRSPEEDVGTRELLKFLEDVKNLTWVLGTPVLRKNCYIISQDTIFFPFE